AASAGLPVVDEAFADRGYLPDGTLVPRSDPQALLGDPDQVVQRSIAIARGEEVQAVDGTLLRLPARSLCLHGDTPGAARLARRIRDELTGAGITVRAFA
ncbi:MAG TPA: LamB/YcsF family protein, partial [Streptomyces sp.]|nr:LamB/YcsF family protein [Streptomyces sp.]